MNKLKNRRKRSDLGTAGSYGGRGSLLVANWTTIRRVIIVIAFLSSTFVYLPFTLHHAIGDQIQNRRHLAIILSGIFLTLILLFARFLSSDNKKRSKSRKRRRENEDIIDSTYRCVVPQVIGCTVVFPVSVSCRDASGDCVEVLDDEVLVVRLAQGGSVGPVLKMKYNNYDDDGEGDGIRRRLSVMKQRETDTKIRLKNMIKTVVDRHNTSGANFEISVFCGTGSGPTGLSIGVSCPGYGTTLATYVGTCLERAAVAVAPVNAPPLLNVIGHNNRSKRE